MMTFSALYVRAHTLPMMVSIFSGLQAIIVAIIANATISFGKNSLKNWQAVLIAFISATLFGLRISPILVILLAAVLGILLYSRQVLSQTTADPKRKVGLQNSLLWLLLAVAVGFIFLFFADRKLFDLATLMFRIDLSAFGGGFASVPLMFHEVVDVHSWLDAKTFLNGIALGQVTPGPIVITATFIGYLLYGVLGGLIATVSIFLPSYILVVGITPYFDKLRSSPYFSRAISGILSSFVGLLLSVTIRFALDIPWDLPRAILAGGAFIALLFKVEICWVVIVTTLISIFILR
jgi:chromate transporter